MGKVQILLMMVGKKSVNILKENHGTLMDLMKTETFFIVM